MIEELDARLEELEATLLDLAVRVAEARAELVFWVPPLTDDELEAAA